MPARSAETDRGGEGFCRTTYNTLATIIRLTANHLPPMSGTVYEIVFKIRCASKRQSDTHHGDPVRSASIESTFPWKSETINPLSQAINASIRDPYTSMHPEMSNQTNNQIRSKIQGFQIMIMISDSRYRSMMNHDRFPIVIRFEVRKQCELTESKPEARPSRRAGQHYREVELLELSFLFFPPPAPRRGRLVLFDISLTNESQICTSRKSRPVSISERSVRHIFGSRQPPVHLNRSEATILPLQTKVRGNPKIHKNNIHCFWVGLHAACTIAF